LAELERVLARPKFRRYIDQNAANEYIARIQRHATTAGDPTDVRAVTRDPGDDYLVALGRQEKVDAIISADLDLLDAGLSDPPAWTPRQLADTLTK
jgi:putative PIN family toxin of toxin-antitoxin system